MHGRYLALVTGGPADAPCRRAGLSEAGKLFRRAGDSAGAAEASRLIEDYDPGRR